MFNPKTKDITVTDIPQKFCFLSPTIVSRASSQRDMVQLLRMWTHLSSGAIPLLCGGISFTKTVSPKKFTLQNKALNGLLFAYWQRSEMTKSPYPGFDASGLICRAAQLCNIPYFYKNSTTAAAYLKPLPINELIHEGDLVIIPGGMLMVSSTEPNDHKMIGTFSYSSGYGIITELKLQDLFLYISNYNDLMDAYLSQIPLTAKSADGSKTITYNTYTLYRFPSVWE